MNPHDIFLQGGQAPGSAGGGGGTYPTTATAISSDTNGIGFDAQGGIGASLPSPITLITLQGGDSKIPAGFQGPNGHVTVTFTFPPVTPSTLTPTSPSPKTAPKNHESPVVQLPPGGVGGKTKSNEKGKEKGKLSHSFRSVSLQTSSL